MRLLPLVLLISGCGLLLDVDPSTNGPGLDGGADSGADANLDASADGDVDARGCVAVPEVCSNAIDDDCDGLVDEGCSCDAYVHIDGTGDGFSGGAPTASIGAAIGAVAGLGGGVVCVAAREEPSVCFTVYNEPVTMEEGVDVVGGYRPAAGGWVADDGCTTVIQSESVPAVHFPPALTDATVLARFSVVGSSTMPESIGVRFAGGGMLRDVSVKAGDVVGKAVGVEVVDSGSNRVEIAGGSLNGSTGTRAGASFALLITNREVHVHGLQSMHSGIALRETIAVRAEGADNLIIEDVGTIQVEQGTIAEAVQLLMSDDAIIRGVTEISGGRGSDSSAGILVDDSQNVIIEDVVQIQGGGGGGEVRGVDVRNGAAVTLQRVASIVGQSLDGSSTVLARGVWCNGVLDRRTYCTIEGGVIQGIGLGAPSGPARTGIAIEFTEALGLVHGATVTSSGPAMAGMGIVVRNAPRVEIDANRFVEVNGGDAPNAAVMIVDSTAVVTNNFIRVGGAAVGIALWARAPDTLEVDVHSNTVVAEADPTMRTDRLGLTSLEGPTMSFTADVRVDYRHNIFLCRPGVRAVPGVREAWLRPRTFAYNIISGCAVGWSSDTSTALSVDGALLTWLRARGAAYGGNMIFDPLVDPTGHLMASSPAINAGGADGAPPFDIDGDDRALDGAPDIGCDEVGP